jgi:hypothetical protein
MKYLKILRILTILLSISLALVSIAGAFFPETYARDHPSMAAQGVGQDLVDLFIAMPLILISYYYASRGRRLAVLIYGGTLGYILYSFIIYSFGVHFNRFFLLYCLTLSLSLYAFILLISDLKQQHVENWFSKTPVKLLSVYLIVVAVIFYALWLKSIVPAIIQNGIPADVADYGLLVNPVHIIDMVFALPALIIGAVLIRQRKGLGYIITSFALVFMVLLTMALAAMVIMLLVREISEDFTLAIVFAVLALTSILFSVLLFRSMITNKSI